MEELTAAAERVVDKHFRANIELAKANVSGPAEAERWDTVYLHGVSMFRHAIIYTDLRHAVKHGDPGRMKALFHYLIPIFRATSKPRYALEMMEVLSRWETVWSDDQKIAILAHSLVNESGRPDGWIGIDLWQKHDVRIHKVDFPIGDS